MHAVLVEDPVERLAFEARGTPGSAPATTSPTTHPVGGASSRSSLAGRPPHRRPANRRQPRAVAFGCLDGQALLLDDESVDPASRPSRCAPSPRSTRRYISWCACCPPEHGCTSSNTGLATEPKTVAWQHLLQRRACGCSLNRPTEGLVRSAGFEVEHASNDHLPVLAPPSREPTSISGGNEALVIAGEARPEPAVVLGQSARGNAARRRAPERNLGGHPTRRQGTLSMHSSKHAVRSGACRVRVSARG
jgi:hypothetical protein